MPDPYDDHGPFDPDELVRWATSYGHPEGWAKKAQQLHAENERLRQSLLTIMEQVESCCSRSGLCIDADRVRAEAQRPMDKPKDAWAYNLQREWFEQAESAGSGDV